MKKDTLLGSRATQLARLTALASCCVLLASCGGGGGASTPSPVTYTLSSGRVQKGPFAVGSSIAVNELKASLDPTGKVYNVQTTDALGDFEVASPIGTPQVEIVAQGFYFDELASQLSASQITLRAIADLSASSSATVNVLTTLQDPRLKTLVSQGMTFAAASAQSESEVLAVFGVNSASVNALAALASMRLDGGTDSDALLLAISVTLAQMGTDSAKANGTTQAAEFSNLVNTIAAGMASSGTYAAPSFVAARNLAETEINVAAVTSNLQNYYANNGLTIVAPPFQQWLDPSGSGVIPQRPVPVSGLTFTNVQGASPAQTVTSSSITIAGVATGVIVPVSVSAGTTIIKNNAAVAGLHSTAQNGDTIALRVTAPGYALSITLTISVGTSTAQWTVTSQQLSGTVSGLTGTGLVLQLNGGDNLTIQAGSTTFSFPEALANGTNFSVTVLAEPAAPPLQVCTISNGTGTVGAAPSGISVVCSTPSEELVVSDNQGNVATYFIDSTTGSLGAAVGATIALGANSTRISSDPLGRFIYVSNLSGATVSAYTVNGSTGVLTPVAGSPFSTDASPNGLVVDGTGSFLYVGTASGADAYTINSSTGALASIAGSPFPSGPLNLFGNEVTCILCVASKNFLYYSLYTGGGAFNVDGFAINASSGALTSLGAAVASLCCTSNTLAAAIDPSGRFFYLVSGNTPTLSAYTIDAATGVLTFVASYTPPPLTSFAVVAVDPTGQFIYTICNTNICAYSINGTTGALTAISVGGGVVGECIGRCIVFDKTGNFAYIVGSGGTGILAYKMNTTTGALTKVPGSPFPTALTAGALAVAQIP